MACFQNSFDLAHDALDPLQHIFVPESDHSISLCLQIGRARSVFFYINRVLAAIDFDDEFGRSRYIIANERADRKLAVEADAGKFSCAKLDPERSFGGRGVEA